MKKVTRQQRIIIEYNQMLGANWMVVNSYGEGIFFETKPQELKDLEPKGGLWYSADKHWIDDLLNKKYPLTTFADKDDLIELFYITGIPTPFTERAITRDYHILNVMLLDGYNWLVTDKESKSYFFENKPHRSKGTWVEDTGKKKDYGYFGLGRWSNDPIEIKKVIEDYEGRFGTQRNTKKGV